ncbi:MAG: hypothetical protein NTZ09_04105 [Candidatus Hydrogenedentes bacterium]|nr:hypothetical protein [Candidatus Hydrogenedentota bacterium]
MGQRIGDYKSTLNQMQQAGVEQKPLGPDAQGKIGLREPLKAPTGWTKFKAALSHVPLLGKLGSLRQARAEVAGYPVRLQQYQVESRQIMAGFMQSLRAEFGEHVATMATHDLDQTGNMPLTGRSVRTILVGAEQAKKNMQSANQMSLTRFLESPIQGGVRLPGEKDMVGLLFDRGFHMPEGATSWKDFLGEKAGNWAQNYINKRLQEHPGYATGRISNADIAKIANEALDLVTETKAQGLSQQQLDAVFEAANKPDCDSKELTRQLREFGVRDAFIAPQLDRKNPQSMLRQTAQAVAKEMGLPNIPDAVLKSIENNVKERVCFSFAALPDQLKCGQDSASIKQALAPVLKSKVETLLREHGQALAMIEKSTVLSDAQKAALRNVAAQRRIDPTQVRTYEQFATQLKSGLGPFKTAITTQNARAFCQALQSLKTSFEDGLTEMQRHGDVNWESGSLKGGEKTTELMGEMVEVALADLKPEERQQLFAQMTSDESRSILTGLRQAQDLNLAAHLPLVYAVILDTVGITAGMSRQDIDAGMKLISQDVPHEKTSPSALLLAAGTEKESRCVEPTSRHRQMVAKDFSGDKFRAQHAAEWQQFVTESSTDETGLATAFNGDLGRARFYLNGNLISEPGNKDKQTSRTAFLQAFTNKDGVVDMKLAKAVSCCFNQRGVNNPMVAMMQAGLNGGGLMGHSGSDYEAWRSDDGSWNIRCTSKLTSEHFVAPGREGEHPEELGGKGYMLASVTYKISAESITQGNPQIEVADSRTFFNF